MKTDTLLKHPAFLSIRECGNQHLGTQWVSTEPPVLRGNKGAVIMGGGGGELNLGSFRGMGKHYQ